MQSAALLKKKRKKENPKERSLKQHACFHCLQGQEKDSRAKLLLTLGIPTPARPHATCQLFWESWAAWTQDCSLGKKMDDRLLPATPPEAVQVGRTFPEPQATRAITGMLCKFSTYQHNGDFPLCDETSSWPQPGQGGSILLLSLWPPDISLLHLQFLWVWSFSYGNRYDKNTCHCEGQQNIICFCKKYQGHPELRNTVAAPAKPAK